MNDADLLVRIAEAEMRSRGFIVPAPAEVIAEVAAAKEPTAASKDLSALPWTSIDNPESRDLDQIEVAERIDGGFRLMVGIADVDSYVPAGSLTDRYAAQNCTSVYTGVRTFPMLPDRLSFDVTSLIENRPRLALIIETSIGADGTLGEASVYPALVLNRGKLAYPSVSAWLDGKGEPPGALAGSAELRAQVQLHDEIARILAASRKREGALDLETGEARARMDTEGHVTALESHSQDRAGRVIEELMIASNRSVARALDRAGLPSLRRVVRRPERWPLIVAYAAERGVKLPAEPSSIALSGFVDRMRVERPGELEEISLSLVKLVGRGEYAARAPGEPELGHFGLAALAYTHSTAPNRRYPDLVTQRIVKAMAQGHASPISFQALAAIAEHCTLQSAAADKVQRRVQKSATASFLAARLGESFSGVVTGANDKGTFLKVLSPPFEGKVVRGARGLAVGDKVQARLLDVSVEKGFIDFEV